MLSTTRLAHEMGWSVLTEIMAAVDDGKDSSADESEHVVSKVNNFANDGSFLELFKKKMEATKNGEVEKEQPKQETQSDSHPSSSNMDLKKSSLSFVGKRRGGKILKTGIVKKQKKVEPEESMKQDAWSRYMAEVNQYKQRSCTDDDKTRPLVK